MDEPKDKGLTRRDFLKVATGAALAVAGLGEKRAQAETQITPLFQKRQEVILPSHPHLVYNNSLNYLPEKDTAYLAASNIYDQDWGFVDNVFLGQVDLTTKQTVWKPVERLIEPGKIPITQIYDLVPQKETNIVGAMASASMAGFLTPDDGRGLYWALYDLFPDKEKWTQKRLIPFVLNQYRDSNNFVYLPEAPLFCHHLGSEGILVAYHKQVMRNGQSHFEIEAKFGLFGPEQTLGLSQPITLTSQAEPGYTFQTLDYHLQPQGPNSFVLTYLSSEGYNLKGRIRKGTLTLEPQNLTGHFQEATIDFPLANTLNSCLTQDGKVILVENQQVKINRDLQNPKAWETLVDLGAFGIAYGSQLRRVIINQQELILFSTPSGLLACDPQKPNLLYEVSSQVGDFYQAKAQAQDLVIGDNHNWNHLEVRAFRPKYRVFLPQVSR